MWRTNPCRVTALLTDAASADCKPDFADSAERNRASAISDHSCAFSALYPDPLLSQVLMAATYPDEFAQAVAWSKAHPDAKGDSAVKMVENQPWDPSVASLVVFPDALITLGDRPDYVRTLGDAFLAQPAIVAPPLTGAATARVRNSRSNARA